MIRISGTFFDGKRARAHPSVMESDGTDLKITSDTGRILLDACRLKNSCSITPPLGDTRRVIMFHAGQRFETGDVNGIKQLEEAAGVNKTFRGISFLESRWKTVVLSIVGLILAVYGVIAYGIPLIAEDIAFRLPPDTMTQISLEAEQILENRFFKPSRLTEEKQNEIRQMFYALVRHSSSGQSFSLHFRQSRALGANAFALPSGQIIMTDKLVEISENHREIEGILVHEMAHIINRHGIRSVIQNTGVVLLISMLAGDVTSITSLAASIPTLLVESGYSRDFETEADEAVGLYFKSKGWDIKPFEDMLIRITKEKPGMEGGQFISSHPETKKRIQHLRQFISQSE